MHLLLRPLLSFIVLVVLAIAVLEVFGRVGLALLPHAEPMLNLLLSPRGVQLVGPAFDEAHDGGVVADPGVEAEVAPVAVAETDWLDVVVVEG